MKTRVAMFLLLSLFALLTACSHIQPGTSQTGTKETKKGALWSYKTDSNGFDTKNFFYDNGEQVVVFDAQFTDEYARKSIEYIRSKTQNPITHVVITHPNPDKFNGFKAFQAIGAKVIASRKTLSALPTVHSYKKYYFTRIAKSFTDKTYPTLGVVDIVFEGKRELILKNGEKIQLTELGTPGVSTNQTVAFIPSQKAWIVGDLVHHKAHAWLEGGIVKGKAVSDIAGWVSTLNTLAEMVGDEDVLFGGRGEKAKASVAIKAQKDYLLKAEKLVQNYITSLGDNVSELSGNKAGSHHQKLQKIFEAEFPEYKLGYMIGYGIYGLILANLPKK